ncbi:putative P-loop containing nucleoside triphosphate hydrolase, leucine-rich repeat domain, L [Medicago truncatula]|uniref:Putative P-loop containing nucleoside triphosphate hydrolase, leucine-rich repeat domain, L n=1 Tax=Medicago truncatula TaxID=3880 RepID=A0A396H3C9_MEDTR|nr:disease resistance protein RGA2 isoform X1 [Medicago truncatula]RHN47826.1 putative P-loop containing nucleoside triphosphate hydrolase, leucine-rich repeat domain, L [Medicago truncatula]
MAESFAFDIARSLLGKLASYAYEEASRAYGVYKDLQEFKDTLSIVSGVLLDAECKKDQKHGLREWLRQIQNICYDAEDVLDGFDLQDKRKQVVEASGSTRVKVRHLFSSSNSLAFRFKMAHQIKEIRDRLDKVAADGVMFGLTNVDPGLVVQQREMTYPDIDTSSVIGRKNDQDQIINLLMQPHPRGDGDGDNSLCVIPIVGIGGLGKTTLAKSVFNDKRMDQLFQLKMWVCISDDFDIRKIIIKIINSATSSTLTSSSVPSSGLAQLENINNLDIVQLVSRLKQKLSGQKFLVVLDDVWNDDRAKWLELIELIKVGAPGSKIIVTTRSNSIASMMGDVFPYVLKGLSPKDCISLFVKWAFKEGEEKNYPNQVEIGKEIVKKCQGVPLAVRTLASSLFSNFDISKWEFVRDSEMWNLEQKINDILPALKLSYDQMPSYLRQCFAYFSLYPKDYIFNSYDIGNLWVALGLVQSLNGSEKLESIARKYIDEMHSRSFIQDVKEIGSICEFKVHDLIHDLALYVSREDFVAVDSHTRNIPQQVRHLSVVKDDSLDLDLFPKSRSVRSILFPIFGVGLESESLLNKLMSRYKYLRYLGLSDSSYKTMPNSIAKLEHLRVLDLSRNGKIRTLPNSICKLLHLQVLDLGGCTEFENLPKGLGKLISLRSLTVTTKQSVLPHDEFATLIHLEFLCFHYCGNIMSLFRHQLPSVEELLIVSCSRLESLPLYIFPELHTLTIDKCEKLNLLLNNESPIQTLKMKHLYLMGLPTLVTLPEWIVCAMETLETLAIKRLPNLKRLPVCLSTMTRLKRLFIVNCPQLLSLPSNMHRLTALERLHIFGCPKLSRKFRAQSGEYWPMISHIKSVFIGKSKGHEVKLKTSTLKTM